MKSLSLMVVLAVSGSDAVFAAGGLTNADLKQWKDGKPVGWKVAIGARRGRGQASVVEKSKRGIVLRGNVKTRAWYAVSQKVAVKPGQLLRLRFSASAKDLKYDLGQRRNCYVGFLHKKANGASGGFRIQRVIDDQWTPKKILTPHQPSQRNRKWTPEEVLTRVPADVTSTEVTIFLSHTGRLEVGSFSLDIPKPKQSFDVLVSHMDRYYSYFAHRKIDWKALTRKYRKRADAAKDAVGFVAVIKEMLGELKDPHVWIVGADKKNVYPHISRVDGNYNFRHVGRQLTGLKQIGRIAFAGRTKEGYGYVAIGALQGADKLNDQIAKAIQGMLDAKGFIIDIRSNRGGDERVAHRFASIFADQHRVYAASKVRTGRKHTDFSKPSYRVLVARKLGRFTKPVVCLIGRRCISSGEGFAAMMKAIPHVTLVGQPTRGASGNPQPVDLPNGVRVYFSRWVAMLPDKTVIEGRGIRPDFAVKQTKDGDAAFDKAREILTKRLKAKSH